MTVESSMKRRLIFSRRFRSAMTCSCTVGSIPVLVPENFLDGGDLCASSGTTWPGAAGGLGVASIMLGGCALAEVKFQLAAGWLVLQLDDQPSFSTATAAPLSPELQLSVALCR